MYKTHINIFNELSKIYEKLGDDIRAGAYHNLAKKLELKDLSGITEKSKRKIDEISKTGKLTILENMKKDKNIEAKLKLLQIIGVGPSLADKMIKKGIKTPEEFIKKYDNPTQIQKMGMKYYGKLSRPNPNTFKKLVECICDNEIKKFALAGSYRTGNPNPGDIDLIVISFTKNKVDTKNWVLNTLDNKCKKVKLDYMVESGDSGFMGVLKINNKYYKIDVKVIEKKYYASFLLYFGSGKYFSKYIRGVAKDKGYKLNQYGIEDLKTGKLKTFKSEEAIFKFLGEEYLTPRERVKYF